LLGALGTADIDDDCTSICCTHLPLREVECADLQQDADYRLKLVGGSSLRQVDWDYETHPPFAVFCSGVLPSPFVPDCLEHDPALNVMFPPKRLPGLDGDLCWR
jgi:hypothetical protein